MEGVSFCVYSKRKRLVESDSSTLLDRGETLRSLTGLRPL